MIYQNILVALIGFSYVKAEYVYKNDIYDASFWQGFDKEEKPYEHDWLHIPDFIGLQEVEFWFNMTHHFLNGIDRGVYMDDSLEISDQCFGPRYVKKINELAAMFKDNFFYNILPAFAIFYQMWYMLFQQCSIDQTINDIFIFCWNDNCEIMKILEHTYMNFLYMTRALLDAGIVWFEGLEGEKDENGDVPNHSYMALSRQTGETIAEIIKEITNFQQQTKFKKRPVIVHEKAPEKVDPRSAYSPEELKIAQEKYARIAMKSARNIQAAAKIEDEHSLEDDSEEKPASGADEQPSSAADETPSAASDEKA